MRVVKGLKKGSEKKKVLDHTVLLKKKKNMGDKQTCCKLTWITNLNSMK